MIKWYSGSDCIDSSLLPTCSAEGIEWCSQPVRRNMATTIPGWLCLAPPISFLSATLCGHCSRPILSLIQRSQNDLLMLFLQWRSAHKISRAAVCAIRDRQVHSFVLLVLDKVCPLRAQVGSLLKLQVMLMSATRLLESLVPFLSAHVATRSKWEKVVRPPARLFIDSSLCATTNWEYVLSMLC